MENVLIISDRLEFVLIYGLYIIYVKYQHKIMQTAARDFRIGGYAHICTYHLLAFANVLIMMLRTFHMRRGCHF